MFDKIQRPQARTPGAAVAGRSSMFASSQKKNSAGVRGAMARGAHTGACCPTGAGSRMTVLGPDEFPTIAAGQRVTLTFTPYCKVEGMRLYLPPNVANLVDVAAARVIGCNAFGGPLAVPGETFANTNSGDLGCALTRIPCISSDNPLEIDLIGRSGIGAEGTTILGRAALIVEDNRLVGSGQVQGAHAAGCCDDNDPTRNTVIGGVGDVVMSAAEPTVVVEFKPYCKMEGLRLFVPEAQAVNMDVASIEVNGCDYRGGAGILPAEIFMNAMDPDFCFPLDAIKCIDNSSPLRVTFQRRDDAVSTLELKVTLFGRDARDPSR